MQTITFTLPPDIATPKFKLFQKVSYGKRKGVVVAIGYTCALEGLLDGLGGYGWKYDISYIYGKTPEQAFDHNETDFNIYENQLHACSCSEEGA